jgi:hypothetical protein
MGACVFSRRVVVVVFVRDGKMVKQQKEARVWDCERYAMYSLLFVSSCSSAVQV